MTAYTHPEQTIVRRILVSCRIAILDADIDAVHAVRALWDTGAMCTCISNKLVQDLGLEPEDTQTVIGANNEPFEVPVYSVQLKMGHFVIPYHRVCALPMDSASHDVIIGMDVMTKGDLAISNYEGKTVITFREPSICKIDFVAESQKYDKMHQTWLAKKNDKCPCGSGRKWENCHGKRG